MVNENIVVSEGKYNIVYLFKDTALDLNVKSRKYTEIHNDNKCHRLILSADSLKKRY